MFSRVYFYAHAIFVVSITEKFDSRNLFCSGLRVRPFKIFDFFWPHVCEPLRIPSIVGFHLAHILMLALTCLVIK